MPARPRADPESRDAKGRTPVIVAAETGSAGALAVLLANRADADPAIRDRHGRTAAQGAIDYEIGDLLRQLGARE